MLKINFGSGTIAPRGWISIDSSPNALLAKVPYSYLIKKCLYSIGLINKNLLQTKWPKNIFFWDIRWGIPFKKNSADIVYASHLLEHLHRGNAEKFLNKCYEILKENGILRLVVPDIDILIDKYREIKKTDSIEAANELNLRFIEDGKHKWMYNKEYLAHLLKKVGYRNVRKLDYRKSKIADIIKLETPKLKYYTSLYIEAKK